MTAALDLVLRQARLTGVDDRIVDIGVRNGRIAALEPGLASDAPERNLNGRLVVPGFVETHIHLDKSNIIDRCTIRHGTLRRR
jgi:cytosine deaminase